MARLPSRKALADRLDKLERDVTIFAGGAGTGAVLARSPAARTAATAAFVKAAPAALVADLIIRQEDALLARGAETAFDVASPLVGRAVAPVTEPFVEQFTAFSTPSKVQRAGQPKPKKKSKFNRAIAAGMKAIRNSTSYGKKGTINNAKKAFTAVTKTASKINKGGKVPKKGIARKIGLAIKGILK
jgi:hypothetical protein